MPTRDQKIFVAEADQIDFDRSHGHYALFVRPDYQGFVVGKVESLMPVHLRKRRYWYADEGMDAEWTSFGLMHLTGHWCYVLTFGGYEAADEAIQVLADTIVERNARVKEADGKFLMVAKLWQ